MTPARRRTPPPWLDLATPRTDHVRVQQCPRCHAPVLRALTGRTAALDVRADPLPLTPATELAARLAGRLTWCLLSHLMPAVPARLLWRDPWHIAAGTCTHHVVADHHCPASGPGRRAQDPGDGQPTLPEPTTPHHPPVQTIPTGDLL